MSKHKYRMLFPPNGRKPGPKGPSAELIQVVVEMKQNNPTWGCPRIAQQTGLPSTFKSIRTWFAGFSPITTCRDRTPMSLPKTPFRLNWLDFTENSVQPVCAAAADTDIVMRAEVLSYSRSRGLFAGISLEGSTLRTDGSPNKNLYGRSLSAKEIVREGKVGVPASGRELVSLLDKKSPKNEPDPVSLKE
jgi:hypothetical protein